jgi:hypothetical protein
MNTEFIVKNNSGKLEYIISYRMMFNMSYIIENKTSGFFFSAVTFLQRPLTVIYQMDKTTSKSLF